MQEPRPAGPQPSSDGQHAPRTRILVVEDDALLAATVCDVLTIEGFAAECVSSLAEVQELLDRETFDLVLTDVGITGAPLSEAEYFADLRARAPGAAIIAMTGDAKALLSAGPNVGFDELIPKPFEIEELTRSIRTVLAERAPEGAA